MAGEDLMTPEQGPHELLVASASDIAALEALYAEFARRAAMDAGPRRRR